MRRSALVAAVLVASGVASWFSAAGTPPRPAAPAAMQAPGVQDVIFLDDRRPILLRLHIDIDGQPFNAVWDQYVAISSSTST